MFLKSLTWNFVLNSQELVVWGVGKGGFVQGVFVWGFMSGGLCPDT